MPSTLVTPADLMLRYDSRTVGNLISDSDQTLSQQAISEHPITLQAIDDAIGRVVAALHHGWRYTEDDLRTLTGYSLSHFKRIVCTFAMASLLQRRPGAYTDLVAQVRQETEDYLKLLSSGHDVFNLEAQKKAGLISEEGNSNHETAQLLNSRLLTSDQMIGRVFPHRGPQQARNRRFSG